MRDGHVNKCKECTRRYSHSYYCANKAKYRERNRAAWADPKKRERRAAGDRRYRDAKRDSGETAEAARQFRRAFPERESARTAVYRAVRKGRLIRPESCSKCRSVCRLDAHHSDYSRQLEVEWLCRRCHREVHRLEKEPA